MNAAEKEAAVCRNMGLVHSCAARYARLGAEYDELVQAGCVGLVKALRAFDPQRGVRFSTYAVPVILGEMKGLFRYGGTVSVPRAMKELGIKAQRLSDEIAAAEGAAPPISRVAQMLGSTPCETAQAICSVRPALSVDSEEWNEPCVPGFETELLENIALSQALETLDSRSRSVLMLRYWGGLTQTETAKRLGMTQVQVSRTESKAVKTLRGLLGQY